MDQEELKKEIDKVFEELRVNLPDVVEFVHTSQDVEELRIVTKDIVLSLTVCLELMKAMVEQQDETMKILKQIKKGDKN